MPIRRVEHSKSNPYFMLNRAACNDPRLSLKAVGLLTYLLSKPDHWVVHEQDIINNHTDGRDAIRSAMRELLSAGYIVKASVRDADGKFIGSETVIHECPQEITSENQIVDMGDIDESPQTDFPATDIPAVGKPTPIVNSDCIGIKENTLSVAKPPDGVRSSSTPKEKTNGHHLREPQGFQIEPSGTPRTKGIVYQSVNKLCDALHAKKKIMRKPSLVQWESQIKQFLMETDVTPAELQIEIDWYVQHIGEDWIPKAYSAGSFCEKFVGIREARERMQKESNDEPEQTPADIGISQTATKCTFEEYKKRMGDNL